MCARLCVRKQKGHTMYYQGRMYIVFHAKSHPFTYVYIFPDMHDSGKVVAQSFRRNA